MSVQDNEVVLLLYSFNSRKNFRVTTRPRNHTLQWSITQPLKGFPQPCPIAEKVSQCTLLQAYSSHNLPTCTQRW